ncbi:hypothetical protein GCM10010172_11550 [Paractinoplanes ferrugineus]|uniref:LytR/CpsA/Psr regulator C-terminal domain-containing protein n=1 Tax=Paractinoplanes ferrugineus TaxID=113564 RepID=A0A919IX06_9ACTN|nr:LytR C-terminal domain-containing protein [Actinoplanes ferrugineus]GIE09719.1 hypothetical protein Afe05nite_15590 [Actinoplanes ferrugineus]
MPHSVRNRLRDLENDVRDLRVLPAAAVRARGRSRRNRQLAAMTAAGAAVVATTGVAFAWPHPTVAPTADLPALSCVLALPGSPGAVQIRVLDGGAPAGLVDATVSGLRTREFKVLRGATSAQPVGVAVLRYGPAAIGAAALVRAEVVGEAGMQFEPGRPDATVDLVLGPAFTRLASPTEINQNLATVGRPSAPPGC